MATRGRALVAGWFSYADGHCTAGDLLAGDLACRWLNEAGYDFHVAFAPPFQGDVDWRCVDPDYYSHVLFVCGPFGNGPLETEFLTRFASCQRIGLSLTMLTPLEEWNPFDLLVERDSSRRLHPDITFAASQPKAPVVGVCRVEEYEGSQVPVANAAIDRLISSREMAVVEIDTRLDHNATRLRTPAEIETLLARMDIVITTRMHGMVLSLKNDVPVIAIDPEAGGAKVRRQAEVIGWPAVFNVDTATDEQLRAAFNYCLTPEARTKARECTRRARETVQRMRNEVIAFLERTRPETQTSISAPSKSRLLATFSPNSRERRVESVTLLPLDSQLFHGASVDLPTVGHQLNGATIEFAGWVLPREYAASAIRIYQNDACIGAFPPGAARPDVAAAFPNVSHASAGYFAVIALDDSDVTKFSLRAVLRNGSEVEFAIVQLTPGN